MRKPVWVIAGSDTSGGAGLQAAIKTLTGLGVPAVTVPTAWTAQNASMVVAIEYPSIGFFTAQLDAVSEMGTPAALVTGMLGNVETLGAVADRVREIGAPLIVDPVLVSTSGATLLPIEAVVDVKEKLIPQAEVVTPNLAELELISGIKIESRADWLAAAKRILDLGARQVWVKGGHDTGEYALDLFVSKTESVWFGTKRLDAEGAYLIGTNRTGTHGTGCTLAAALGGAYAHGYRGIEAALLARMYLNRALRLSEFLPDNRSENIFFHGSWPQEVTAADLPLVAESEESFGKLTSEPRFPLIDGKIGFYPVVDSAEWVEKLVARGVKTIQLRAKGLSGDNLRAEAERADKACRKTGARFFLNDDWRLAMELGCYGVHLGQEDLLTADINAIRKSGLRLGVSTHCFEELGRAMALKPSYVALGPIFPTKLKAMRFAPQGVERIKLWRKLVDIPLVAIGGITLETAPEILRTEIDGIAVVNDVLSHGDPIARTDAWIAKLG